MSLFIREQSVTKGVWVAACSQDHKAGHIFQEEISDPWQLRVLILPKKKLRIKILTKYKIRRIILPAEKIYNSKALIVL